MYIHLSPFLLHWAITSLALWAASKFFSGVRFETATSLIISALLLGFVNAIVRPLLVLFTLPLTLLTLGFFLLVINALMIQLVAALVSGFKIEGFWKAFFVSIFMAVFSWLLSSFVIDASPPLGWV